MLLLGTAALVYTLVSGGPISLPVAGSGVVLIASAFILFTAGAFGELVFKLGDVRDYDFSRLTQRISPPHSAPQTRNS
jgi:hypothetical protein